MATLKYPLSAANGELLLSQDDRATVEAITQVLQTKHGERVFRNYFGSDLSEFDVISDLSSVLGTLELSIANNLNEYTPLSLALEGSVDDSGVVSVYVEYQDSDQLNMATVTL
jgi:phage baseplate assembly protein W